MNNYTKILMISMLMIVMACSQPGISDVQKSTSKKALATADVYWEDVKVQVFEVAKIPLELSEQTNQIIVDVVASGTPPDHFRGYDLIKIIEFYDDSGQRCFGTPIKGQMDDVLLQDKIQVLMRVNCRNQVTTSLQLIFRASTAELLNTVTDKFKINVQEKPSDDLLTVLTNISLQKEAEKKKQQETTERLQAENIELKRLDSEFEQKLEANTAACISANEFLEKCFENKPCELQEKSCRTKARSELCNNKEGASELWLLTLRAKC